MAKSFVAALLIVLTAFACAPAPAPLEVTFYYTPGCPSCEEVKLAVLELEKELPGRVRARVVDATGPGAATEIAGLGFEAYGLVVRKGGGQALFKQADAEVDMEQALQAIEEMVGP